MSTAYDAERQARDDEYFAGDAGFHHAVAPALHRAFAERLPAQRYRDIEAADAPVFAEMRDFLERSTESLPDVELAMWMVATGKRPTRTR